MTLSDILRYYKKYDIEYNRILNIITIPKTISVEEFVRLKKTLKNNKIKVDDIRVFGTEYSRTRAILWRKKNWVNIII